MPRPNSLLPLIFAFAVVFPAAAQTSAATPTASEPSKQCITARKKEDKEQRSLNSANESIARDTKARESCSSKSMCTRYDTAISATEKRKARHETRLARFKEDAAKDCKAP